MPRSPSNPNGGTARPRSVAHMVGYVHLARPFAVRLESLTGAWWAVAGGYDPAWRTRQAVAGAGCLLDNGYHGVYPAEALACSPIVEVYARTSTAAHAIDVDDSAPVLANVASGAATSLQVAWSAAGEGAGVQGIQGDQGAIAVGRSDACYRSSAAGRPMPLPQSLGRRNTTGFQAA